MFAERRWIPALAERTARELEVALISRSACTFGWLAFAFGFAISNETAAQCELQEEQKLLGSAASYYDTFGSSPALDGSLLAIGADSEDSSGVDGGAVYLFELTGDLWTERQVLYPSDLDDLDFFGSSVDLEAPVLVASSPWHETGRGAVFVFRDTGAGYIEEQKLMASDAEVNELFGVDVAIDGTRIAVGAPQATGATTRTGAVYLFEYETGSSTWIEVDKIYAADGHQSGRFGDVVILDGDRLVVGSCEHGAWDHSGAVYVYEQSAGSWNLDQKIFVDDAGGFSSGMSLDGDRLAVGAPYYSGTHQDQGAVYLFERSNVWAQIDQITAHDAAEYAGFGTRVALDGETILAYSPIDRVYVLRHGRQSKLTASDGGTDDQFGWNLALDGDTALVGARLHWGGGIEATGAVFAYDLPDLQLGVDNRHPTAGESVTFDVCLGETSGLVLLFLIDVDGSPILLRIGAGTFDSEGEWSYGPHTVPPRPDGDRGLLPGVRRRRGRRARGEQFDHPHV